MSKTRLWLRAVCRLALALLILSTAIASVPARAAPAQVGCADRRGAVGGPAQWLVDCGRMDVRGAPEAVARAALASHAAQLGLRADGGDLRLLGVAPTPTATHVRFNQVYRGVPVFGGQVLVQYSPSGELQLINNHTVPNPQLDVTPAVDISSAVALARAQVAGGGGDLRSSELVIDPNRGAPALAWHIVLFTAAPLGEWHVMVAARSGKLLRSWNAITFDSGSGAIYDPNPVQQTGNTGLADANDATSAALTSARTTVTLNHLDPGTGQLKGSYADLTGTGINQSGTCGLPYTPGQANQPTRAYSYTRDDDRFEEVNAYAAIDGVQSWFQALGFTNILNRPIPVDAHCISADNSFFSSGDGALHFGDGGVDDAEDADIVVHEYGHAVQSDQVPGWGAGGDTEQGAMGEGFGDFLAGIYSIGRGNPSYLSARKYCIGEWDATGYNPVTAGNAGSGCLRWINGRDEATGADVGRYSGTPVEVHSDGRYWSAALTCMYEGMGANAAARAKIMRIVLQHHFSLTPDESNSAFEDAVSALVLADQNLYAGADRTLIKSCAYARGLIPLPTPTITAPAEGAALAAGGTATITWVQSDSPANTTYRLEYSDNCNMPAMLSNKVEGGMSGWTTSHSGGILDWQIVTSDAHSPTHSWYAGDEKEANDQYLVSPPITLGANMTLSFWHHYNLETSFDGGVAEISTNNGTSWSDLGAQFIQNGYNASVAGSSDSPLAGRGAFTGSHEWVESKVDLGSFGGKTVRLRFREADDPTVAPSAPAGWWIDDLAIAPSIIWKPLATALTTSSYRWNTPSTHGSYCLRVRASAPGLPDSAYSAARLITVGANGSPTISVIADRGMLMGFAPTPIGFTIGDAETAPANLTLSGSSSNTALVPNATIVFGGSGAARTVSISPAPGKTGASTITITVSDSALSASTSFVLTVSVGRKTFLPLARK